MDMSLIAIIVTIGLGIIATVGSMIGMMLWGRSESRSDTRMMLAIIDAIQKEIKDFHGRLCIIEEKKISGKIEG